MDIPHRSRGGTTFKNRRWVAGEQPQQQQSGSTSNSGRWERGGHRGTSSTRGRGNGRVFPNASLRVMHDEQPPAVNGNYDIGRSDEVEPDDELLEEEEEEEENEEQQLEYEDVDIQPTNEPDLPLQEDREKFYQEVFIIFICSC